MELRKWNYLLPASVNHMGRWFLAVKTNDLNIDIKQNRKKEQQKEAWSSRSRNFLSARGLTSPRGFTKSKGTSQYLHPSVYHTSSTQGAKWGRKKKQKKTSRWSPWARKHPCLVYLLERGRIVDNKTSRRGFGVDWCHVCDVNTWGWFSSPTSNMTNWDNLNRLLSTDSLFDVTTGKRSTNELF